jgi:hypothetical protein
MSTLAGVCMNDFSSILFARPSVLEGAARILDFANLLNEYQRCLSPEQADELALNADWRAIGDDILFAIRAQDGACRGVEKAPQPR